MHTPTLLWLAALLALPIALATASLTDTRSQSPPWMQPTSHTADVAQQHLDAGCHCVVLMPPHTAAAVVAAAFASEPRVCVVSSNGTGVVTDAALVYVRRAHDPSCLVEPPGAFFAPPDPATVPLLPLSPTSGDPVAVVNALCGTFRAADGSVSAVGRAVAAAEVRFNAAPPAVHTRHCRRLDARRLTAQQFWEGVVLRHESVVLTHTDVARWPAASKWTTEWLNRTLGGEAVHVKVAPQGSFEGTEPAAAWGGQRDIPDRVLSQLAHPDDVLVRPATRDFTLTEFFHAAAAAPPSASFYLEYLASGYLRHLWDDVPDFDFAAPLRVSSRNLWLGVGDTVGHTHFDPFENLMAVLDGTKVFHMVHPLNNSRFGEGHIREAKLRYDDATATFHRDTLLDSTSIVNTPVSLTQRVNVTAMPWAAGVQDDVVTCAVHAGEVLYVPSFYWHEVASSVNPVTGRHLAVNFWFDPVADKTFPCAECPLTFNPAYISQLATRQAPDAAAA